MQNNVVLLHGLGRTFRSMKMMATAMNTAGFQAHNINYPSMRHNIQWLTDNIVQPTISALPQDTPIHVVTHSLGGILIRQYLQGHNLPPGSRIVMLAPPNHGSEVADHLMHWKLFQWILGPSLQQLGTNDQSTPNQLQPIQYETGIITGNRSVYPPVSWWISGPNDGLVSVGSARLEEMKDFRIVPAGHGFIMCKHEVIRQSLHFLKHGFFY